MPGRLARHVDDLLVGGAEVEVRAYPGVVCAGAGALVWAHAGVATPKSAPWSFSLQGPAS